MRSAIGLFALVSTVSLVHADAPKKAPETPTTKTLADRAACLDPIQVDSLTLTPIVSTQPPPADENQLVLDEAMPQQMVKITEFNEGDVIIGGKQDRIIGR